MYPRNLRTYTSFIANITDRLEIIILLKLFKYIFYSQNNPRIDFSDLIFQDYSGESLNLIFNLIFAILNKSFRFDFFLLNPKPQVYFNSFNKILIFLLLNYFLFLLENIIKKI
jgi:hypothetical protein